YIQDAIRHSGIIRDDNWSKVWNFNLGFYDKKANHVQVYIVSKDNSIKFYDFLLKNHEELIEKYKLAIRKDEFIEKHKDKIIKKYKNNIRKNEFIEKHKDKIRYVDEEITPEEMEKENMFNRIF